MNVIAKISCYLERGVVSLKSRKDYLNSVTHTTSALLRIKNWTVWYTGVTNCQKTVRFFWPTLNFWHSGTLALRAERQSARMSEIKHVG